ncbi:hypothetical protein D9758_010906 [Tetrapyrgos nigripes]|uniref:DUF6593 domain-containing protein n=1 Tax=Tetrapyrgos nigripes TaxID=182062 RepID=A0A8H5CWF4_9AGAR|nr:hypothetical protein D9758_010906 [Tetrapyrgos nigripes]
MVFVLHASHSASRDPEQFFEWQERHYDAHCFHSSTTLQARRSMKQYLIAVLVDWGQSLMELTLSERDVSNAAFLDPTGRPYTMPFLDPRVSLVAKPRSIKPPILVKKKWGINKLKVFSSSEVFTASDRHSYKWKHKSGHFVLYSKHGSEMIASYDSGSRGFFSKKRPPKLTVLPQGLPVVDEVVATLIYMVQKRRQRARSSGAAAAAGASGAGG